MIILIPLTNDSSFFLSSFLLSIKIYSLKRITSHNFKRNHNKVIALNGKSLRENVIAIRRFNVRRGLLIKIIKDGNLFERERKNERRRHLVLIKYLTLFTKKKKRKRKGSNRNDKDSLYRSLSLILKCHSNFFLFSFFFIQLSLL